MATKALIKKGKFGRAMLYHRRMELGLTLDDVAERSGLSQACVQAYESGRWHPTPRSLWKLSLALQVSPAYFFEQR